MQILIHCRIQLQAPPHRCSQYSSGLIGFLVVNGVRNCRPLHGALTVHAVFGVMQAHRVLCSVSTQRCHNKSEFSICGIASQVNN